MGYWILAATFFAVVTAGDVHAFEIDGFRSGESPDEVSAGLERRGLKWQEKNVSIVGAHGVHYNVGFCGSSLVSVQKDVEPSYRRFVEIVAKFNKLYGQPGLVATGTPDPTSSVVYHSLSVSWRDGRDVVSVSFTSFASNEQLSVHHEARNSCYGIPDLMGD